MLQLNHILSHFNPIHIFKLVLIQFLQTRIDIQSFQSGQAASTKRQGFILCQWPFEWRPQFK